MSSRVHAVVFDDPHGALHAVHELRKRGFEIQDVHSPFPVHGMEEALGLRETRLAYGPLAGGILGLSLAVWLQTWTHAVDWPLDVGGKSMTAFPAIVPVSFELTVLIAGLATFVALVWSCRLRPIKDAPASQPHPRVNDDRFVVLVVERDGSFVRDRLEALTDELGAEEFIDSWRIN